jgi:amino acid transporter
MLPKLKRFLFGAPRNVKDPKTYHAISLVALLAWVGLGADGLSSSAYGPEEAFRALGSHTYLALGLAIATAVTVFLISFTYSKIIEHFPYGGGGYMVASRLLGHRAGVVSGSALIIDYVLTISVSIAAGADQIFSVLPAWTHHYKLVVAAAVITILVIMNLRGVKESVTILAPIFALFLITHAILIFGGLITHSFEFPMVVSEVHTGFDSGLVALGWFGMLRLFLHAYSMGGGTYTGIEAVSNGLQIMREPKVETGKRTMLYMSFSLAITAGGILVLYLLFHVTPVPGKTLNAVLLDRFAGHWMPWGLPLGHFFVVLTLATEAVLLFVAAQAGFIDGPRVMSNMAIDSWLPHRFAQLSDRLTMQNGVLLMGGASIATLIYTEGNITALVTMYSINVFLTFSLSQLGMCRFWFSERGERPKWKRNLFIHLVGFVLCGSILIMVIIDKFDKGAWLTIVITTALVSLCFWIKGHYRVVKLNLHRLNEVMNNLPAEHSGPMVPMNKQEPTAVLLVADYGGLGIHQMLTVPRLFQKHFKNYLFVSVGVVDSATMKGATEVDRVIAKTEHSLKKYVDLAHRLGLQADFRMSIGTEAVAEAVKLCNSIPAEFPNTVFFAGKLVFQEERWFHKILHNETAYQIQRRLQFSGLNAMVLPVRVYSKT